MGRLKLLHGQCNSCHDYSFAKTERKTPHTVCSGLQQDEMNFELVAQSFHSSEIVGIDACIRKPIVASVSSDHTVRLWNFLDK